MEIDFELFCKNAAIVGLNAKYPLYVLGMNYKIFLKREKLFLKSSIQHNFSSS